MSCLTKPIWPDREIVRVEGCNYLHWGCCLECNQPLQKWRGKYYGVFNNYSALFNKEFSYFTGYCRECAKKEALNSRNRRQYICPPVIERVNYVNNGAMCERKYYADGSIVEG